MKLARTQSVMSAKSLLSDVTCFAIRSVEALRARIAARWPEKETVADDPQDGPLTTMCELTRYWAKRNQPTSVPGKTAAL